MRMRTVTAATTLAVLFSSAALAATPAFADTSAPLPIKSLGDIVVDGAHQQVFISDPSNGKIVVTDYSGNVLKQLTTNLSGVDGLALSADSGTLYAAVRDLDAIAVIDTATDNETTSYTVGDKPRSIALAGGRLWFGYGGDAAGNIGSVDLTDARHTVTLNQDNSWYSAPVLDAAPGTDILVAGDHDTSPASLTSYNVSSGSATQLAHIRTDGGDVSDLQVTPDGKDVVVASGAPYYHQVYKTSDLNEDGKYTTTAYPNSVAIAPDGTVAAGSSASYDKDIYVFNPGSSEAVRSYDLPNTGGGSGSDLVAAAGLAWAPDGSRLFAATYNSQGAYALREYDSPAKAASAVTVNAPASAPRAKQLTVTGTLSSTTALPAGAQLTVTRTDLDSPNGKALPAVTVNTDGTYSFTDTPPAGGKVTYKVSYAGDTDHAAASGKDTVDVSRAKPTLTLNNNGKVYAYGKDVKFTAHLGTTYKNRTVEIWADPFGSDKPNKKVKSGKVDAHGNLSVTLDLKRDTKVTAKFSGDARWQPRSVSSTVGAKVSVSMSVSRQYRTKSAWGQTYYVFHQTKNPLFTTKMPYYDGRSQRFDFQVYYQGKWYSGGDSEYFRLATSGLSSVEFTGNHKEDVGWRFRVRSDYINGGSGDTVNSTTYGAWKYFMFTG
ncbi:Ig-like domain repeat protein [Streptomyces sp. NPDC091215]|uniref:Ig-like domain repeat protein n=1 Tax=Streptomyces sp. NPDC091215 TaxID=3155192 RepID=UPI003441F093